MSSKDKETSFVLYLVILFTLVRLTALLVKARFLLAILAVFSCIFIASNYNSLYKTNSLNIDNSKALADNINSYSSKYWTNQETFKELTQKQESLIKETKELPNIYLVISLIVLIELSLVYLVATLKIKDNEIAIHRAKKNRLNNATVTNATNKAKVSQSYNNAINNESIVTKDLQDVTNVKNVTNCNNLENKSVTKSKVITNIRAKNPYAAKKVDCNNNVTDDVTSVAPKNNNVAKSVTNIVTFITNKTLSKDENNNKQQDIYNLSKQDFIAKYKIKESYYRVLKSRFKNKAKQEDKSNESIKLNETANNRSNKANKDNISNTISNNQSFTVNNLQQELMVI